MKIKLILYALKMLVVVGLYAQPKDNPMASFYGDSGDYAFWTDEINWSNVKDMSTYSKGSDNFEKFQNACLEAYNEGGGVLYYPEGTYNFDIPTEINGEGLMLLPGVVIRGDAPDTDIRAISNYDINTMLNTDNGLTSMKTKFIFERDDWNSVLSNVSPAGKAKIPRVWNMIGMKKGSNEQNLGDVSHVGVAWVEIEYGYIWFGMGSSNWSDTWAGDSDPDRWTWLGTNAVAKDSIHGLNWKNRVPDGTLPADFFCGNTNWGGDTALLAQKMFVFGVHLKNSLQVNYMINKTGAAEFQIEPNNWRFGGRLGVYGEHLFIANNVISKPTECFLFDYQHCSDDPPGDYAGVASILFDYGYGIGIDVNKNLATAYMNRCILDSDIASIFYAEDVIIQDNFVYNNGHKSIEAAGKYLVIKNNIGARDYLRTRSNPYNIGNQSYGVNSSNDKCHSGESADDMMSRFIETGGFNVWISGNKWSNTGSDFACDGESFLIQRHNGIEAYSIAMTYNEKAIDYLGGSGYIAPYDINVIGLFQGWNKQPGATGVLKIEESHVEDISAPQSINLDLDGSEINPDNTPYYTAEFDLLDTCFNEEITPADSAINFSVLYDNVNYRTIIEYEDNTDIEIAYRIEKQKTSLDADTDPWNVIAYRPRQETNDATTTIADIKPGSNHGPDPIDQCYPSTVLVNDMNPSRWIDYKANPDGSYRYRVVTIGCDNTDEGATNAIKGIRDESNIIYSASKTALDLKITPNPAVNFTKVSFNNESGEKVTIDLMDMNGKLIKTITKDANINVVKINVKSFKSGVYLLKVITNNGRGIVDKLIVE